MIVGRPSGSKDLPEHEAGDSGFRNATSSRANPPPQGE